MSEKHEFQPIWEEFYLELMENEIIPYLEKHKEAGRLKTNDSEIYYESYVNSEEKGAIVISHGFCEFTTKYTEVIYYFFSEGYSVFIMDHRGHGYSSRKLDDLTKVYIDSYSEYVKDFHVFVEEIVKPKSKTGKLALFAHSMGGAIGALVMEHYPELFQCAILSAPMLEINIGKYSKRSAWLLISVMSMYKKMQKFAPGECTFSGEPHFEKSHCLSEARYMRIFNERQKDPNRQTAGATYSWVAASLKALRVLQKNTFRIQTPILLFQAEMDEMVKPGGQDLFVQNTKNARLVKVAGSKHEIHNAILKDYYAQIFEFLEEKLS